MIKFKKETTLQIIENFDEKEDCITDYTEETFKAGEKVDADIYSEDSETVDIQFGDGSVAVGIQKSLIEKS